jgi:hypothetical protein
MGTSGLTPKLKWYQFKHPKVTESTKIKQGKGTREASGRNQKLNTFALMSEFL